jgi:ABC-2 type transport system permease protein
MSEVRALAAVVGKDLRTWSRYPLGVINLVILAPLLQFLLPSLLLGSSFAVGGQAVGLKASAGTDDLAGFLFTGAMVSSVTLGTFWGVALTLTMDRNLGTLQQLWVTPTRRDTLAAGAATSSLVLSLLAGLLLAAIGALLFGASYLATVVLALPALALAAVAMVGIGHMVAAAVLLLRRSELLIDLTSFLFAVASGALFPIAVLPGVLELVPLALPTTYALDQLRFHALGTEPLLPAAGEYAALAVCAVVYVLLGRRLFRAAERRIEVQGTVQEH